MANFAFPGATPVRWRAVLTGSILLSAILLGSTGTAMAQQLVVPPIPDPVAVSVDPSTTALLVVDLQSTGCPDTPACATVAPIGTLLTKARSAGALVAYSTFSLDRLPPPEDAPQPGETLLVRPQRGPDWEEMDGILQGAGIQTVVLTGNSIQEGVLYWAYQLTSRYRYTVVVPVDGTSGANEYRVASSLYQMLNVAASRSGNPSNTPLAPGAVTLSRSDLVSFQPL